jgi:hypothetical protein
MQSTDELHRSVYQAVQSRDFDGLREIYHTDCSYMTGDGVEQKAIDEIEAPYDPYNVGEGPRRGPHLLSTRGDLSRYATEAA